MLNLPQRMPPYMLDSKRMSLYMLDFPSVHASFFHSRGFAALFIAK